MSHCYICDKTMDEVHLDHRDLKPRPCSECEQIIFETLQELDSDSGEYNYIQSELSDFDEELHGTGDEPEDEPECVLGVDDA